MFDELKWVHGLLRRDLATCQHLATEAGAGAPVAELRQAIERLHSQGPLFQLRVNCIRYCQLVHHHHGLEDAALFPAVRRSAPHLGTAVDRLEADHHKISALLDEVEASAHDLQEGRDDPARSRLVAGLRALATDLLEHLDYEEATLGPVLSTGGFWR